MNVLLIKNLMSGFLQFGLWAGTARKFWPGCAGGTARISARGAVLGLSTGHEAR